MLKILYALMMAISSSSKKALPIGILIVLWLVGWTLRLPVLAAPPLATRIASTFDLTETGIAALTMLPIMAIAFGAILSSFIIVRLGIKKSIVMGMLIAIIASTLRGQVTSEFLLFLFSFFMGLGIALFQTALPSATKELTPVYVGLANTIYLNGMMVGELSGAGLTLPIIMPLAEQNWRFALIIWAIPMLIIMILSMVVLVSKKSPVTHVPTFRDSLPKWNDKKIYQYGILLGSSVISFYIINSFLVSLLEKRNEVYAVEGLLFAYNTMPIVASIIMLVAVKWIGYRTPVAISIILSSVGLIGFIFFDSWISWLGALITGAAATIHLILMVSLSPAIATGNQIVKLSAGITLIGFSISFILPILGGWLAHYTGWLELALIPSLIFIMLSILALGKEKRFPNYK
ncbi:MAG: MFS transporter [Pseudomonadota bacterium]